MTGPVDHPASPEAEPTLRERKRAAAKARVVDVAIRLFAERGYAETSVDEICAAADVAPRSFFRYFPTKEAVLLEPVREMADRLEAAMAAAPPGLSDAEVVAVGQREVAANVIADWERLSRFFQVAADTGAVRSSPLTQLARREEAMTRQLLTRRGETGPADWRTRLLVARSVAGFRVWLDDVRTLEIADPLAHLDEILAAD
ncbi:TetR family transcriptional regulator [Patulibacter americanus]|uniref:TetR family transcriptional regulator n=1 Tax=Patulibacter americanus TaxID=588672 RepID=UPI0003B716D3|nr:TetR/AcrR family transcriptional regulator [Patulibacter americanus]